MTLFEKLSAKAKSMPQRIVLPEGTEPRTLSAADRILADGLAEIILIGSPDEIMRLASELKLDHIGKATIVNPSDEAVIDRYAPLLLELRRSKGMTEEESRLTTANPLYLGCLMVKDGDADGQVAGAMNTTGNVLRAAFQVIKTQKGISVVSGAFIMLLPENLKFGTNGILVFADCAVVPDPSAEELAQIAVSAAQTARDIAGIERDYLRCLRYADASIGRLVDGLRAQGLLDSTLLIIASDHHVNMYSGMKPARPIAFIAANSGHTEQIEDTVHQADVFPTVLDLLGVQATWRGVGHSMLGPQRGESDPRQATVSDSLLRSDYFPAL